MRNALDRIQADMRISTAKLYNTDPTGPESLQAANARMVGLTTFHIQYLDGIARDLKKAFETKNLGMVEYFANEIVNSMDDLKKRAERGHYLD